jgi:zinc transporter ZupT
MTLVKKIVNILQTIAFYFAVGIIVWLGLIMVLPANAEAKEATKSKLISVLLGFLAMISATIIVNIIINFIYDILS